MTVFGLHLTIPILWLVLAVIFLIIEALTVGLDAVIRGIHRVESHGDLHLTAVKACAVPNTGRSEAASQDPDSFLSFQTSVPPCTKGLTVHSVSAASRFIASTAAFFFLLAADPSFRSSR